MWIGCGYELLPIFHYPLSWARAECPKEKNGKLPRFNLREKRILSESNWVNYCIKIWKKGQKRKILIKFLQWPCSEPLNVLLATSTRKRHFLHRKTSFPLPCQKKKKQTNTSSGSDEGKIVLHSLDRDLRLALRNFFYYVRN